MDFMSVLVFICCDSKRKEKKKKNIAGAMFHLVEVPSSRSGSALTMVSGPAGLAPL